MAHVTSDKQLVKPNLSDRWQRAERTDDGQQDEEDILLAPRPSSPSCSYALPPSGTHLTWTESSCTSR